MTRPTAGQLEERSGSVSVEGRRIRGVIPFGIESRDLGGFTEIIEPGALRGARLDDLVATVEHRGIPIGRHPATLTLEERSDGAHWSVDPPQSRSDVVEAIQRGDLRAGSWRMRVGRDEWRGDVRHIHDIAELRDVSVVAHAAYDAPVEFRSNPKEDTSMSMTAPDGNEAADQSEDAAESSTLTGTITGTIVPDGGTGDGTEKRSAPEDGSRGRLHVRSRSGSNDPRRGLYDEFRHRGFPGERAEMPWDEFESRAVTWSASVDLLSQTQRVGGPLGQDQRYAWTAFARIGLGADVTSVRILQQTARALAPAANVVRAIDAVTTKPETGSTVNLTTVPLKQVATKQSGIPNTYLLQPEVNTLVEQDLRLAINEGLDKLLLDTLLASGFQVPGTDNRYVSIRKAMSTLLSAGYNPDLLVLTPADAELLDLMVSGIAGGTADFVNGPGAYAPDAFNLVRRVSKNIPATTVFDSAAYGRLYAGPVSLAKFEENFGQTNSSTVRLELNAVFGAERQAAAVRIAAA